MPRFLIKKTVLLLFIGGVVSVCMGLLSCSQSGGLGGKLYDPGYGPFDKDGNYIEALADAPAKQRRKPSTGGGSSSSAAEPEKKSYWERKREEKREKEAAKLAQKQAEEEAKRQKELAKAEQRRNSGSFWPFGKKEQETPALTAHPSPPPEPVPTYKPSTTSSTSKSYPKKSSSSNSSSSYKKPVAKAPVKPAPKPVAKAPVKPAPKPVAKAPVKPAATVKAAPKARQHIVAKGDTLYSISRRYGSSVSAIQKANGISGTTIILGQRLKVP